MFLIVIASNRETRDLNEVIKEKDMDIQSKIKLFLSTASK